MSDLISRQAAIDAFKKELTVGESKGNYVTICSAVSYEGAKQILESLPSAQSERKHGKWVDVMIGEWCTFDECKCSVCGVVEYFNKGWKKFSYCPNCGARMEDE